MTYLSKFILVVVAFFATLIILLTTARSQNLVYIDQVGNSNSITVEQKDSDGKTVNIVNQGDANILSILQQGTGAHNTSITNTSVANNNNNNNFTVSQSGSGNHTANIVLNNTTAGASNNTASITQLGNTGADKSFTLNLTGNGIGFTGIQDNLTTPDSASMSITCLTPPCSGYSYTKH